MDRVYAMSTPASIPSGSKLNKFNKWHRLILSICFIVFAGELGLCLIVLPWLSNWEISYIPVHSPRLSDIWMSPYFRGVLSGLGLLNVYVALAEIGRLIRTWFGKASR
jgi:hypothetical protein